MTWPPSLLRIRIVKGGRKRVGLWLPLLLVWPLAVVLWLVLLPLLLVAAILWWPSGRGKRLLLAGPAIFRVFCALRKLSVDVESPDSTVRIHFW
ncbi:MAG: hypothetical protein FJ291_12495 [Planctomycetes bacterium]|nr:hypothetical protein [Planctomycetota bacterium]